MINTFLQGSQASSDNIAKTWWREYHSRNDVGKLVLGSEPLSDALIFEPVPYRSAVRENCTHVIALRTRADDLTVTAKMSLIEKMIMSRYFSRKQGMPEIAKWMHNQVILKLYLYVYGVVIITFCSICLVPQVSLCRRYFDA